MRSRYSAYAEHAVDYIIETCLNDNEHIDFKQTKEWSEQSKWLGLKIISVNKGGPADTEGTVEFEAVYERDGLRDIHHEKARFVKKDNKWLYKDGDIVPKTITRTGPKTGRNDPCPCGSGKKYKHCGARQLCGVK
jgi:SEC-C motif-containing protein